MLKNDTHSYNKQLLSFSLSYSHVLNMNGLPADTSRKIVLCEAPNFLQI